MPAHRDTPPAPVDHGPVQRVLITGAGGATCRALVPMLGARGVTTVTAGSGRTATRAGGLPLPDAGDPAFVTALTDLATTEGAHLVIPTTDRELLVLAGSATVTAPSIPLLLGPPHAVEVAGDAWHTYRCLRAAGIPVPRTLLGSDASPGRVRAGLGLPFVTRPRVGRGARLHHRMPSRAWGRPADDVMQEFAPGTGYEVVVYLAEDPAQDVAVVLETTQLPRGSVSRPAAMRRVAAPDVGCLALEAGRALGLRGPVEVSVRRAQGGAPVVLRVDARTGPNARFAPEVVDALLRDPRPRGGGWSGPAPGAQSWSTDDVRGARVGLPRRIATISSFTSAPPSSATPIPQSRVR